MVLKLKRRTEWVGEEKGKFNMIFQFEHLDLWDAEMNKDLDIVELKKY